MRRPIVESVQEFTLRRDIRSDWIVLLFLGLLIVAFGIYVVIGIFVPDKAHMAPILSLVLFLVLAIPIAIWHNPKIGVYLLIFCACVFVQSPKEEEPDPFTVVPVFWNVSTIGYNYLNTQALGSIQFNMGEAIIVATLVSWGIQEIMRSKLKIRKGLFFPWLTAYMIIAMLGGVNGMATGGDHTFVLWELRAQVYFYLAYLMATNILTDRASVMKVLWAMTIGIALKSVVGTRNFIANPNVTADEGVLRHEDSLVMNMVVLGALLLGIGKMDVKLRRTMLLFVPTCITTVLANGRRASIAALLLAMPITMVMCAVMMKEKRKQLITIMGVLGFVMAIYTPIAWNGKGVWALPARAIRSQFDPSDRDASSDYYRLAETANLKYTRDLNPWIGYGYGKEYITIWEQYGRTDVFARILPHNGIMWIWMRLGHPGFFCFWMFFASVMIWGPQKLKSVRDPKLQVLGIFAIGAFLMLVMYGKYDLAFANYRAMILVGTLLGICAATPHIDDLQEQKRIDDIEALTFRTPVETPEEVSRHDEEAEEWRNRTQW